MADETYELVFEGELAQGVAPDEVKQKLASIFEADLASVDQAFSGTPLVKMNLPREQAMRSRQILTGAGAMCAVRAQTDAGYGMICPKCGAEQRPAAECARCGVLIAKATSKAQDGSPGGGPPPATESAVEAAVRKASEPSPLAIGCGGVLAAVGVIMVLLGLFGMGRFVDVRLVGVGGLMAGSGLVWVVKEITGRRQ